MVGKNAMVQADNIETNGSDVKAPVSTHQAPKCALKKQYIYLNTGNFTA